MVFSQQRCVILNIYIFVNLTNCITLTVALIELQNLTENFSIPFVNMTMCYIVTVVRCGVRVSRRSDDNANSIKEGLNLKGLKVPESVVLERFLDGGSDVVVSAICFLW